MNDKYIIRNCPCYNNERFLSGFLNNKDTFCTYYNKKCQDCTDCIMKQIVKRCKKVRECTADICTNPYEYATYCETRGVLQLLDIQECEND